LATPSPALLRERGLRKRRKTSASKAKRKRRASQLGSRARALLRAVQLGASAPESRGSEWSTLMGMSELDGTVQVMTPYPRWVPEWAVPEVPVPESDTHDLGTAYLVSVLQSWAERSGRTVKVARNLGIRWYEPEPRVGFDPDVCLLEPPPPDTHLGSLCLWREGHAPPWLAIEVVSPGHPYKDYVDTPARCAAAGIGELWIYDPLLVGPTHTGGPYALQVWSSCGGTMRRVHAASSPGISPVLGAWLHPSLHPWAISRQHRRTTGDEPAPNAAKAKLRLSDAEVGGTFWPTCAEAERERAEAERQRAEAERQRAEAERQRADAERQRADEERQRADVSQREAAELRAELERLRASARGPLG
jgi:Putative restriction endonuclease